MRILLVEDDVDIVRTLTELLSGEGFSVDAVGGQTDAIEMVGRDPGRYALALLDVTLEEGNGFAVCSAIRSSAPEVPVIFLTASDDEFNTVAGLSMGAEDYVAKPFRPRELLARIQAVLRRTRKKDEVLRLGPVLVEPSRARASKGGRDLELSAIEYRLLLLFAGHAGGVVTREMMREALWEDAGAYVEDNTLSVYVKRLRDKIEDDPAEPQLIRTVRGIGYRAGT